MGCGENQIFHWHRSKCFIDLEMTGVDGWTTRGTVRGYDYKKTMADYEN